MLSKCNDIDDLTHYINNNKYFLDKQRILFENDVKINPYFETIIWTR